MRGHVDTPRPRALCALLAAAWAEGRENADGRRTLCPARSVFRVRVSAETFADWGVDYLKYDYCDMARVAPAGMKSPFFSPRSNTPLFHPTDGGVCCSSLCRVRGARRRSGRTAGTRTPADPGLCTSGWAAPSTPLVRGPPLFYYRISLSIIFVLLLCYKHRPRALAAGETHARLNHRACVMLACVSQGGRWCIASAPGVEGRRSSGGPPWATPGGQARTPLPPDTPFPPVYNLPSLPPLMQRRPGPFRGFFGGGGGNERPPVVPSERDGARRRATHPTVQATC